MKKQYELIVRPEGGKVTLSGGAGSSIEYIVDGVSTLFRWIEPHKIIIECEEGVLTSHLVKVLYAAVHDETLDGRTIRNNIDLIGVTEDSPNMLVRKNRQYRIVPNDYRQK